MLHKLMFCLGGGARSDDHDAAPDHDRGAHLDAAGHHHRGADVYAARHHDRGADHDPGCVCLICCHLLYTNVSVQSGWQLSVKEAPLRSGPALMHSCEQHTARARPYHCAARRRRRRVLQSSTVVVPGRSCSASSCRLGRAWSWPAAHSGPY